MYKLPLFQTSAGEQVPAQGVVALDGAGEVLAPGLREVLVLASNVNAQIAAGAAVAQVVYGGSYILLGAASNWNSASAQLQMLLPDGSTWITIATRTANDNAAPTLLELPSNATVRLLVATANPTGLYVSLSRRP